MLCEQRARGRLGVELLQDRSRWPNEGELVRRNRLGEGGILGEEAVARVNGVAAGGKRRGDDRRCGEVALLGVRWTNADRLVGNQHCARVGIRLAVGDHRLKSELATGAQDAQRNLATIRNQDALDHLAPSPIDSSRKISWPYSTGSPVADFSAATIPPCVARTSVGMPSTSTVATSAPFATLAPT